MCQIVCHQSARVACSCGRSTGGSYQGATADTPAIAHTVKGSALTYFDGAYVATQAIANTVKRSNVEAIAHGPSLLW